MDAGVAVGCHVAVGAAADERGGNGAQAEHKERDKQQD